MNLVHTIEQYNDNNIIFCEPIKNNIMNDGHFIRIMYSTSIMSLNGIYLLIKLNDVVCEKYYNKYKCSFNVSNHLELIEQLKTIEETILTKYNPHKIACYKIYEQIRSGVIKLFYDVGYNKHLFILKISGIWETQHNIGLTYKFIKIS